MATFYSIASIGFFGGGFFHSWQYVGICVVACLWSFVLVHDARAAGCVFSSWRSDPPRAPNTRRLSARIAS